MKDKEIWQDEITPNELIEQLNLFHRSVDEANAMFWSATYFVNIANTINDNLGYYFAGVYNEILKKTAIAYENYKKPDKGL